MDKIQKLWWEQAKSDHDVFVLLRREGSAQCHLLHYLQMVTEKIAKAYFWQSDSPPPKNHAGFVQILRFLSHTRHQKTQKRVAELFTFQRFSDFQNWIHAALQIAYELERLAPSLSNDGPNPEYPWPHRRPEIAPVNHQFHIWSELKKTKGRNLMRVIGVAVDRFPEFADT